VTFENGEMAGIRQEPEIEIQEYEEIVWNWDQASVRERCYGYPSGLNPRAHNTNEQFDSMTHRATDPETN